MNTYVFGGYVKCSGKLDSGKEWANYNVLLLNTYRKTKAEICKAVCNDNMTKVLESLQIGCTVEPSCDMHGRIIGLVAVHSV